MVCVVGVVDMVGVICVVCLAGFSSSFQDRLAGWLHPPAAWVPLAAGPWSLCVQSWVLWILYNSSVKSVNL